MRHFGTVLIAALLTLSWAASAPSQDAQANEEEKNGPNSGREENRANYSEYSLETFDIVFKNNIFDPNRRPERAPRPPQAPTQRRLPRETIELTGVMIDEEMAVAFFDGSNRANTGACEQGQKIGDFFLMELEPNAVTLQSDKLGTIILPIGSRMGREGEQGWKVEPAPARSINRRSLNSIASARSNRGRNSGRNNNRSSNNNRGQEAADRIRQAMQSGAMGEWMSGMMGGRGGRGGRGGGRRGGGQPTTMRAITIDGGAGQGLSYSFTTSAGGGS